MSEAGLAGAVARMRKAGSSETAIDVFSRLYRELEAGATGKIAEADIDPLTEVDRLADVEVSDEAAREALRRTAVIKLNGGLGTSMGLDRAKTLLPVRDGATFLDLICAQIRAARAESGAEIPLLFMDSFRTDADTVAALAAHPDMAVDGLPLTFVQNQTPKLRADDLTPVDWPADPSLEWCPPGHGDLFTVLHSTGLVEALLARGMRHLFIANSDNLGAVPDGRLAAWFAATGAPFAMELCERSINDRKGGHVAVDKATGALVLRDTAMVVDGEMDLFTDWRRHHYFNTNNLWLDLAALQEALVAGDGVIALPMIRNAKTVDPADKTSTPVIQLETGMGTALQVFDGATAIVVGRDRFRPVKTTNELLLLRSDLFELDEASRLVATVDELPEVRLDPAHHALIDDFEARIPVAPSLRRATALRVSGDWTFADDVEVVGEVALDDPGSPAVARGVLTGGR